MPNWLSYKGITIPNAPPGNDAGLNLKNDLAALADRVGPCNFSANTSPTSSDDASQGYEIGSFWVNTSINGWFVCTNNTPRAAVWDALVIHNTAVNLADVVLAAGQFAYAIDTHKVAIGDGTTTFSNLGGALLSQYVIDGLNLNLISATPVISNTPLADMPSWVISDIIENYLANDGAPIFVVGASDIVPTILDSGYISTDGHGDFVIISDGTQGGQALSVFGPGDDIAAVNIQNMPTGTLDSPPAGLQVGDLWLDTTTSATYPIVRSYI